MEGVAMTAVADHLTHELLTSHEAAALLRISRDALLDQQGRGNTPAGFKVGNQWRFRRSDFDALLGSR
jgi:excisionase family DNA binding protein